MALKLEITFPVNNIIDVTPNLRDKTLTVRWNTLDFTLVNSAGGTPQIAYPVRILALGWSGTISSSETRDPVDIRNGQVFQVCTATNTAAAIPQAGGASYALSDQPTTVLDDYLLEDGSGHYLLESGSLTDPGAYQMEGARPGYSHLSVKTQTNGVSITSLTTGITWPSTSTFGQLRTYQGGLWPGIEFALYSNNQGINGTLYVVTECKITWPVGSTNPFYDVTFGLPGTPLDIPWTLRGYVKTVSVNG